MINRGMVDRSQVGAIATEQARRIACGEKGDDLVEQVFAAARDAKIETGELLEDVRMGSRRGQRPSRRTGAGVELVAVNGHSSNGHHRGADKPEQTLFSRAEFIAAEPTKPKGRRRKPRPATASLFEWA